MPIFDILVIAILVFSVSLGIIRGFIKEVFSILSYGLAIIGSIHYSANIFNFLENHIETLIVRTILSYLIPFLLIFFSIVSIGSFLKSLIFTMKLSDSDRSLGGVFGIVRGVFIVIVLIAFLGRTDLSKEKWWTEAFSPKIAEKLANQSNFFKDLLYYLRLSVPLDTLLKQFLKVISSTLNEDNTLIKRKIPMFQTG